MKYLVICILVMPVTMYAEKIDLFVSDIVINTDGSFVVTETIDYDFDGNQRRGIYRSIPLTVENPAPNQNMFQQRYIGIEFEDPVTRNGQVEPRVVTEDTKEIELRIGDPQIFLTGQQQYQYSYTIRGGLDQYDVLELYWNATGNEWQVPIDQVTVRVSGTDTNELLLDQRDCYVGITGSGQSCDIQVTDDQVIFTAAGLATGEGITIAQALDGTQISHDYILKYNLIFPGLLIILGLFGNFLYRIHAMYRRNYKNKSVITQFDTVDGYSAMFSGVVIDGQINARDITAGLIELARQGYVHISIRDEKKIIGTKQEYEITLKKTNWDLVTDPQRQLLTAFFGIGTEGKTYQTDAGTEVAPSDIQAIHTALEQQLQVKELKEVADFPHRLIWSTLAVFILVSVLTFGFSIEVIMAIAGIAIAAVVMTFALTHRWTKKGYEAAKHLQGLKQYILMAEKDRLDFHNAPERVGRYTIPEQPIVFMKYLPYAIAFGIEKQWVSEFRELELDADWIDHQGNSQFTAKSLGQAITGFSTGIASTTPVGSGGASSGGGFSGGGVGGGGGGSW